MRATSAQRAKGRVGGPLAVAATIAALALGVSAASAQISGGGGTAPPPQPEITDVRCLTKCIAPRMGIVGSRIRVLGSDLHQARVVSLPRRDGRRAKDLEPVVRSSGAVLAVVKRGAVTGPVRVADRYTIVDSETSFRIGTWRRYLRAQRRYRFPVRGPHDFGGASARFGAPRSGHRHQGHDVFARCGTRLVAARGGRVQFRGFQGSAGFYVVIDGFRDPRDFVYMHLRGPARVRRGATVATGQTIGQVGQTGNAVGCHLHFELWRRPGWYQGGSPFNPLPTLLRWDRYS